MKFKQQPEDFEVEEVVDVVPAAKGPFALYLLEKRGLGTPEAIQTICRRWRIERRRVSVGGLKDRHAVAKQYLTIYRGPQRGLSQQNLALKHLGMVESAFTSSSVYANRFQIVLRDLSEAAGEHIENALEEVQIEGVANYFDDQRFGSVGPSRQFVARRLIDDNPEGALKLALTEPFEHDRSRERQEKSLLRKLWGDWNALKSKVSSNSVRRVVSQLATHPDDYWSAFSCLPADMKSLYLAAYQSHLWNLILARWIEGLTRPDQQLRKRLQLGQVIMWRGLDETQRSVVHAQSLPLPSARYKPEEGKPEDAIVAEVMKDEGLQLAQMKLKQLRSPFFSKGERPAAMLPEELTYHYDADELHEGRLKMTLNFTLPRGCYATLLIKRVTAARTVPVARDSVAD